MDNLRYANIALDWFCLVLSFLPVVYLVSNQRYREKLNQYFLGACLSNMVMTLGDLPDWFFPTVNAYWQKCQRRMVKNLKRRPENDPNAGNIALVIYAGTLSAGQLSAGSSAGGTGWTPAFHRSLSR